MDYQRQNGGPGFGRDFNRAERFEDEKRRIVESCFNKKDVDGSSKIALGVFVLPIACVLPNRTRR